MIDLELKMYQLIQRPDMSNLEAIDIFNEFRVEFNNNIENCFKALRKLEIDGRIKRDCSAIKPIYLIVQKT